MADGAVRDQLVDDHMSLVRGIAGKVHKKVGQHVEYDDFDF